MKHLSTFFLTTTLLLSIGSFSLPSDLEAKEATASLEMFSNEMADIAEKALPAVVFIKVESNHVEPEMYNDPFGGFGSPFGGSPFGNDDFFNRYFGFPNRQPPQPLRSQGSGFLVSSDGFIMTNAHVVKGADKIEVTMHDGQVMLANLVGVDPQTDIAIIKIEGKNFPFLTFANSDELRPGNLVLAIGSPFQLESSVTMGIISGKRRQGLHISENEDYLQIDAAINPGNSGGPFITMKGEVGGVNTAIVSPNGGYVGIGLSVASNLAKKVMDQLIEKGSVTRGFLGISFQPVDKDIAAGFSLEKAEGILISEVAKGSPAEKGGLKQGDIILRCNGKSIQSFQEFRNEIAFMGPGSVVELTVNRKGEILTIPVTLGTLSNSNAVSGVVSQKLGIEIDDLSVDIAKQLGYTKGEEGVVITMVKRPSVSFDAGLRPGYLILTVNHKKVTNLAEYNEALSESKSKRIILLVKPGRSATPRYYSILIE